MMLMIQAAGSATREEGRLPLSRRRDDAFGSGRGGWLRCIALWSARYRERRALANLDDRQLADIGVTRAEVAAEIRTPFWK